MPVTIQTSASDRRSSGSSQRQVCRVAVRAGVLGAMNSRAARGGRPSSVTMASAGARLPRCSICQRGAVEQAARAARSPTRAASAIHAAGIGERRAPAGRPSAARSACR